MALRRATSTTIMDLAREARVSKSTVSLVLNESPLVGEAKRRRVQEAIRATGYVYNRTAARLRAPTADVIGMVINDLANPFFAEMALGIEAAASRRSVMPFVANAGEDPVRQLALARAMFEHGAMGFILSPANDTPAADIEEIAGWGVPVVFGIRDLPIAGIASVTPANRAGAAAATRHLLALGHRRIAFLGGRPGVSAHDQRRGGYEDALGAAGVAIDASLIVESAITRDGGAAAVTTMLARAPDVTAIFAFNDLVAIGAMHALDAHGREPGRDVAIVGFDDIDEARWMRPALTTVAIDAGGLGVDATELLLELIDGALPRHVERPAELVVRASCGTKREGNDR